MCQFPLECNLISLPCYIKIFHYRNEVLKKLLQSDNPSKAIACTNNHKQCQINHPNKVYLIHSQYSFLNAYSIQSLMVSSVKNERLYKRYLNMSISLFLFLVSQTPRSYHIWVHWYTTHLFLVQYRFLNKILIILKKGHKIRFKIIRNLKYSLGCRLYCRLQDDAKLYN